MAVNMDGGISLLRGTRDEDASFSLMFFVSALLHLFFFAAMIFAPVSASRSDFLSAGSVINVSMVTLPAPGSLPEAGGKTEETDKTEEAMPGPEPAAEAEVQEQAVVEPEPEPASEPEPAPAPEPEKAEVKITEPEKPKAAVAVEPEKPKPPEKPKVVKKEPEKPKVVKKEPEKPKAPVKKTEEPVKHKKPDERVANSKKSRSSSVEDAIDKIRRKVGAGEGKNESSSKNAAGAKKGNVAGGGRAAAGNGAPGTGGGAGFGLAGRGISAALEYYKQNIIPNRINNNWAISEHLLGRRFGLEAIMVIKIMPNGQIADFWFEKKSGDRYLDESAERAVRKSNPLPPLPGDFTGSYYEVGLRFTPSGLN